MRGFASPEEVAELRQRAGELVDEFDPAQISVFSTKSQACTTKLPYPLPTSPPPPFRELLQCQCRSRRRTNTSWIAPAMSGRAGLAGGQVLQPLSACMNTGVELEPAHEQSSMLAASSLRRRHTTKTGSCSRPRRCPSTRSATVSCACLRVHARLLCMQHHQSLLAFILSASPHQRSAIKAPCRGSRCAVTGQGVAIFGCSPA